MLRPFFAGAGGARIHAKFLKPSHIHGDKFPVVLNKIILIEGFF